MREDRPASPPRCWASSAPSRGDATRRAPAQVAELHLRAAGADALGGSERVQTQLLHDLPLTLTIQERIPSVHPAALVGEHPRLAHPRHGLQTTESIRAVPRPVVVAGVCRL